MVIFTILAFLTTKLVVKALNEDPAVWKLIDFGLAAEGSVKTLASTKGTKGTKDYKSPELVRQQRHTNKVDIWGLGCILYELCTGCRAIPGGDWGLFYYLSNPTGLAKASLSLSTLSIPPYLDAFDYITEIPNALKTFSNYDESLYDPDPFQFGNVDKMVAAMLHPEATQRPTAKQIETHCSVNMIVDRLKVDQVHFFLPLFTVRHSQNS